MTVRDGETGGCAKLCEDRGDDGCCTLRLFLEVFVGEESRRFGGEGDRVGDRVAAGALSLKEFANGSGEPRSSRLCKEGEGKWGIIATKTNYGVRIGC